MREWPVQDAKAHFSEFLDTCLTEGPQLVSRRGEAKAVLVPLDAWNDLNKRAKPGVKDVLLADEPRFVMDIPSRKEWEWRSIPAEE
ncbi:type II toxin-antitoxin system Phd/YefM family antitoxin [Pararhizobium sp. LjRoot238]|uniref:type II toxin-antitoxin system Phd/YefM family antitoxin n=1 Tax=Pararhizobium sp. LjRoot238 TaxID=3342293 RepID=UPI003F4F9D2A